MWTDNASMPPVIGDTGPWPPGPEVRASQAAEWGATSPGSSGSPKADRANQGESGASVRLGGIQPTVGFPTTPWRMQALVRFFFPLNVLPESERSAASG
jgi:hypothetical protein